MPQVPFRFGLEGEYLLVDRHTWQPLWHPELRFAPLNSLLEAIDCEPLLGGLTLDGLELDLPHRRIMPFYVEGYGLPVPHCSPDELRVWGDLLPKGIEIRTPVCDSLFDCLAVYERLYQALQIALGTVGYRAVALAHHPTAWEFTGPQNHSRHDWWQWGERAMTTYGPDLNISLPAALRDRLDWDRLGKRVNYYAPALAAFSAASPVVCGGLWLPEGETGLSARTWRRSAYAPAVAAHPKEGGRLEFKAFDMPQDRSEFLPWFLLWLWLACDEFAPGEADDGQRIGDLQAVARHGWNVGDLPERAEEAISRAERLLPEIGFDPAPLGRLRERRAARTTPADRLIDLWQRGGTLPEFLQALDGLASAVDASAAALPANSAGIAMAMVPAASTAPALEGDPRRLARQTS